MTLFFVPFNNNERINMYFLKEGIFLKKDFLLFLHYRLYENVICTSVSQKLIAKFKFH